MDVGFSLSLMVIVIEQVVVRPTASVTVQFTVVIPIGYVPEALPVPLKSLTKEATTQLSLVTGIGTVIAASQDPGSLFAVISEGQVIVGAMLSPENVPPNTVTHPNGSVTDML